MSVNKKLIVMVLIGVLATMSGSCMFAEPPGNERSGGQEPLTGPQLCESTDSRMAAAEADRKQREEAAKKEREEAAKKEARASSPRRVPKKGGGYLIK